MNQTDHDFPELVQRTRSFTLSTRGRLVRALIHSLQGRSAGSNTSLREVVADASREMRLVGFEDAAILAFFGSLVEDTGRACGADRPSLMSGQLRWMPVRARVLALAAATLDGDLSGAGCLAVDS